MFIKFFSLIILTILQGYAADPDTYYQSDLSINSKNFGVTFYHRTPPNHSKYASAIIYGTREELNNLRFKKYSEDLFYLCLDEEEKYNSLTEFLEETRKEFAAGAKKTDEISFSKACLCRTTTVEDVARKIWKATNLIVTFGAGMSSGYVPTLIDFFKAIDLEKTFSDDSAEEESFIKFIQRLVEDKEPILKIIQSEWGKIFGCTVQSTPAHEALRDIIDISKRMGKNTFVYTDNIDGVHHKLGITLSEWFVPEEHISFICYPPTETLLSGKTIVLVCGQSFDFHGVLSTIHSRTHKLGNISFISINPSSNTILAYKGMDVDLYRDQQEALYATSFPAFPLNMTWLQGSAHDILPAIYNLIKD